jgi:hypothetical protein
MNAQSTSGRLAAKANVVHDAVVVELVGHVSGAKSRHYTQVGKESLSKAVAALPEL